MLNTLERAVDDLVNGSPLLTFLKHHGCQEAQGYFIGRPGSAADIATRLVAPRP